MQAKVIVLEGDGIGPEIIKETIKILKVIEERFNHQFELNYQLIGASAIDKTGEPLPKNTLEACYNADAILFGTIGDLRYDNNPNAKIRPEQGLLWLRKAMGLYANIRPVKSYAGLEYLSPLKDHLLKDVDFVVFRELTSGIYFGDKKRQDDEALDVCSYKKDEIMAVSRLAFEEAMKRKKHLTLIDKANVLETSRLWRETVTNLSEDYPHVELDCLFVDNAAMKIIQNPAMFDVVLTENMFGDIITDEASVITGSLGMLPSASIGGHTALYEPIHGSYPQAAGKNIANPMAAILSLAMMLDMSFHLEEESSVVVNAVQLMLEKGIVTKDLNDQKYYSTSEVGDAIADVLR